MGTAAWPNPDDRPVHLRGPPKTGRRGGRERRIVCSAVSASKLSLSVASPFAFDVDTAFTAHGDGRYSAMLSDRWHIGDKTNGGYLLAVPTRAMGAAMADATGGAHVHPLSVTGHYLRPGEAGPAEMHVEVARVGRKLSTASATFVQGGKERIRVIATFGNLDTSTGPRFPNSGPPDLPAPEACLSRSADRTIPFNSHNLMDNVDNRMHPNTQFLTHAVGDKAEVSGYIRFADGREPDVWSLPFFVDASAPSIYEVLEERSWVPTIELTVHVRAVPAPGWLRLIMRSRFIQDGFFEEDGELWDSQDRLVAVSRQLAMVLKT